MKWVEFIINAPAGQKPRKVSIRIDKIVAVYMQDEGETGIDIGARQDYVVKAIYADVLVLLGWQVSSFPLDEAKKPE